MSGEWRGACRVVVAAMWWLVATKSAYLMQGWLGRSKLIVSISKDCVSVIVVRVPCVYPVAAVL